MSSSSDSEDEVVEKMLLRKRKAARAKKDPTKPKRGLSPYFCFMREKRPNLVAARPGLKIGEVTKVLAARWNKLGPADREKFIKMADEDKSRYLEEMKIWEAKQRESKKTVGARRPLTAISSAANSARLAASSSQREATTAASVTTSTSSASSHVNVQHLASYVDAIEQVSFQFSCRYCAKRFANDAHLTHHLKANHGGKREMYQCRQCSYFSAWRIEIARHLRGQHRPQFKSGRCYKTTSKTYKKIINKALADSIYKGANGEMKRENEQVASADLKWDGADEYKKKNEEIVLASFKMDVDDEAFYFGAENEASAESASNLASPSFSDPSNAISNSLDYSCYFCPKLFPGDLRLSAHENAVHIKEERE